MEASKAYYKKSIELEDEVAKLRGELKLARDQWNTMDATLTERDAEIKELRRESAALRADDISVATVPPASAASRMAAEQAAFPNGRSL